MRFVMQAGFAWPALTPLTVDLLCKLIGKQARLAATLRSISSIPRRVMCVHRDRGQLCGSPFSALFEPAGLRSCFIESQEIVCSIIDELPSFPCHVTAAQGITTAFECLCQGSSVCLPHDPMRLIDSTAP